MVGGDHHHGILLLHHGLAQSLFRSIVVVFPLLNGHTHPVAAVILLLGCDPIALLMRHFGEILNGGLVVHQRLHRPLAIELCNGRFRLDHRDGAGIAPGVYMNEFHVCFSLYYRTVISNSDFAVTTPMTAAGSPA